MEKLRTEKEKYLTALKAPREVTMNFDLRQNAKQYIQSTRDGMEVLKDSSAAQNVQEKAHMKSCMQLLNDTEAAVDRAIDVTSPAAANKYNELILNLNTWRTNLAKSGGLYNLATVAGLRAVADAAEGWSSLVVAGKKTVKEGEFYEVPEDSLTQVVQSEAIRQNVQSFLSRCDAYYQETKDINNDQVKADMKAQRERLKDCQKQKMDIVAQFKNGEISRSEAEFELQEIKFAEEDANFELKRLEDNRVSFEAITARKTMIVRLEHPIKSCYNMVKNNRLHIHALFNGMDFSRLISIVNNNCTPEEFNAGVEEMQRSLLTRGYINQQGELQMNNIQERLSQVDNMLNDNKQTEKQEQTSLLDALLGNEGEKQTTGGSLLDELLGQEAQPQEKTRLGSIDDIM
jgi:ribosome-associated translation inhibitor RaiA